MNWIYWNKEIVYKTAYKNVYYLYIYICIEKIWNDIFRLIKNIFLLFLEALSLGRASTMLRIVHLFNKSKRLLHIRSRIQSRFSVELMLINLSSYPPSMKCLFLFFLCMYFWNVYKANECIPSYQKILIWTAYIIACIQVIASIIDTVFYLHEDLVYIILL